MTFHELYVLNSAIDGEDIYSLPEFSTNQLPKITVELIKDSLVQKGYLLDYETVTDMGAREISKMKQFKESKKYISIFDMVIGCIDHKKGILLKRESHGEYSFVTIDVTQAKSILVDAFPVLFQDTEALNIEVREDKYVNARQLLTEYPIYVKTSFTLTTTLVNRKEEDTKELFFESCGGKYYYDCMENILHMRSGKGLINVLEERLEVM